MTQTTSLIQQDVQYAKALNFYRPHLIVILLGRLTEHRRKIQRLLVRGHTKHIGQESRNQHRIWGHALPQPGWHVGNWLVLGIVAFFIERCFIHPSRMNCPPIAPAVLLRY